MKQLIIILAALAAGAGGGYWFASKKGHSDGGKHACDSKSCKECKGSGKGGKKVAKGFYLRTNGKEMWSEISAFTEAMKANMGKKYVNIGGYINKFAVQAAIESLPDSVKAMKYYFGLDKYGRMRIYLVGGLNKPMNFVVQETGTQDQNGPMIIGSNELPNDTTPTFCPPACMFDPNSLISYPADIIQPVNIDPSIQPADDEGTGGGTGGGQ